MSLRLSSHFSARIKAAKPVLRHGLLRYRYFVQHQESRLASVVCADIRVSVTVEVRDHSNLSRRVFSKWHTWWCSVNNLSHRKITFNSCVVCYRQESRRGTDCLCRRIHTVNMPGAKPFERLPKTVVPRHYDLVLQPNLKTFAFDGEETIKLEVQKPVDKIVLNSLDLQIKEVEYESSVAGKLKPANVEVSVEDETATFSFAQPLEKGSGTLCIKFTGELNDKMKGFYRSKYTSPDGEELYAGVTQFEATDARRCFPCWDEPAIKATFNITLVVPKSKVALSNMPVIKEEPHGENQELRKVKFDTTPVMSTYLVAVVVGEYDYIEDRSNDGVLVRVYTPVGKKEQGKFALEVATKVLPYYKDYFQIAYPLPKIDLIAIADFSAGAMENWGLVTYRENCLLVDPQNTSAIRKQWIALVVGHELAHQWFGNLVTMEWWTHLWLNEGYASFVEFLCVEHLFPDFDIWTQFVTDTYIRALELDCLKSSHPIEVPVGHPAEIDEIFDDISYNKGASVIRMLHRYIGDKDFRKGMNLYLTKHQYKNTFTEDLWAALEEASNKPVGAVMSTWTKQMGFPVVKVESHQEGNSRVLSVTQEKFCADGGTNSNGFLWMVPISFSTSKDPECVCHQIVLQSKQAKVTLSGISDDDWVKVNPGTVGYYRTRYPSNMLSQFVPAIRDKTMPPLDRLGLLDDLFAMVQAGHTPTVEVLKLMEAFTAEDNYTVWCSINNCLGKLAVLVSHTDFEDLFKEYGRELMTNVAAKLGWNQRRKEDHLVTLLRSLVIGRLGTFGDETVIAESKIRFEEHATRRSQIPADLRTPVYRTVLSVGDESTYDSMLKLYREADLHEEKDRISRALGAIKDEAVLRKVLQFAMSEEVRSQDSVFVIISVAGTKVGRELAWKFFKENWKKLMDRYEGGFLIARLVKYITENFASEENAVEVEQFFKANPSPGTERTVQQSVETIRLNAVWLKRDEASIRAYLMNRKKGA